MRPTNFDLFSRRLMQEPPTSGSPIRFVAALAMLLILDEIGLAQTPAKPQQRLVIMNADGTDRRVLVETSEFPSVGSPAVSPDGKRIAFDGWQAGQSSNASHIFLMNLDGSGIQDLGDGLMPNWSPDGKRLAISRSAEYGVWLVDVASGELTSIEKGGWGIQWSPDGKSVSFTKGSEFYVQDLATGTRRELLGDASAIISHVSWNSCWSPDSQRIICMATLKNGQQSIVMIQVAGAQSGQRPMGHVRFLATGATFTDFAWHPTQPRVLVGIQRPKTQQFTLYEFHPEIDGPPELFVGPDLNKRNASGSWTPDGKQLVYVELD